MNEEIEVSWSDPEADIDMLLSEIPQGYKVQVKRTEPPWAKGVVATVDYDPTDPVSAKWIVDTYGGRKYQIKVLDERGRYKYIRAIEFPDPPLKDGAPIVPGPNGSYILESQANAMQAQPPAPTPQGDNMSGLFTTMLEMQTQQANSMQTLMMTLLSKTMDANQNAPVAPALPPPVAVNPQSHMKDTLEMFKGMEELRNLMGGKAGEVADGDPENPLYGMLIDKLMTKFTDPAQQKSPQPAQQGLNLQQGNVPPPPSNLDLAMEIKERLKSMQPQEKEMLLSCVLDEEEEETPVDTGQDEIPEVESLLTQEDEDELNGEQPENGGEEV